MDVSVLMATYKRNDTLKKTLDSFCTLNIAGLNWELIVVDNACDVETKRLVTAFSDRLPIVFINEKQKGKNFALNAAIQIAKGSLFIFTDDDIIAQPNWLLETYEGSKRWSEHNIFGGKILPQWPEGQSVSHLNLLTQDFYNASYAVADWKIDEGVYSAGQVWGPNMAVRKSLFDQGVKFDTSIGPSGKNYIMGSETEFTKRMERNGHKAVYLPKSLVFHQIRPEQLTVEWLSKRAFNYARADVYYEHHEDVEMLFGAPRYLQVLLIKEMLKNLVWTALFNKRGMFQTSIKCAMYRGMIFQYRQNSESNHHLSDEIKSNINTGKVSVIIPTYNRQNLVIDTIESVLAQTYKNLEIIVVDDGSQDDTVKNLKEKYCETIQIISQPNKGNSAARNRGLLYATGEFVAFLDDDDHWLECKLEKEVDYLNLHPDYAFVYGGAYLFDENGKIVGERIRFDDEEATFERLFKDCIILSPSVALIRRSCLDKVGYYDERIRQSSDYDLWLRLAKQFKFGYLDEYVAKYRVHEGNLSRNLDNRLVNFLKIFNKYSIVSGKSWFERRIKIADIYYYIATLCRQNHNYTRASKYYFYSILRCPFIGFYHWPSEIKKIRFSFVYRIFKTYWLVIYMLVKGTFLNNDTFILKNKQHH